MESTVPVAALMLMRLAPLGRWPRAEGIVWGAPPGEAADEAREAADGMAFRPPPAELAASTRRRKAGGCT